MTGEELAGRLARLDEADRLAEVAVDWGRMLLCPVCKSERGRACRALSGRVAGGRPDGVTTDLTVAHAARKVSRRR